jgi:uncharacterized protein YcfJ
MKLRVDSIVLAATLFTASTAALAAPATVIDVDPIERARTSYETVYETVYTCDVVRNNDRMGGIERGVDSIFGSTGGAVGTVIGGAIGNQIGKGRGNDIATALGAVLGNQIGNNASRNKQTECREIEVSKQVPVTQYYIEGYRVTVDLDGNTYRVTRRYEPAIGSQIDVNVSVR